ncbi:LuxR C-terminal-related transcriptional regulator [Nocardia sp. NPDC006044]|uniref:helix-turn-helix transcriptional regulator n=1 Tax=Nocardia sp. NPDC006044 TaxID=3364306 RepID=UPI0036B11D50
MAVRRDENAGGFLAATGLFVGRERELDRIISLLLGTARLVTLIGSGGIGKTRLAGEGLRRFHKASGIPTYWVRLAQLDAKADLDMIEAEVARSVVGADFSNRSAWTAVVDTLARTDKTGGRLKSVLVMDNCEHILDGAGRVVSALLEAVPALTVVATSREALGWVDEQLVAVPSLTRPEALTLFQHRAGLAGKAISDPDEVQAAAAICRHVHNNPLFIQLAAAKLRYQPLANILRQLTGSDDDRRTQWLHGPRVGVDARHMRVADVIAWSYDLCSAKEQLLLERMSVFAPGFDANTADDPNSIDVAIGAELEAIARIGADCSPADRVSAELNPEEAVLTGTEIEALVERLVDQSLVTVHFTTTTVRYSLLESIRVFARERLNQRSTDAWTQLAHRHARYYRDKVVEAKGSWFSPAEKDLLEWVRAAWDNLRVAIEGCIARPDDAALGLEILIALTDLRAPFYMGSVREMRRWIQLMLEAACGVDAVDEQQRIRATATLARFMLCQGQREDTEQILAECCADSRRVPAAKPDWRADCEADLNRPASVDFLHGQVLMLVDGDVNAINVLDRASAKFRASGDVGSAVHVEMFSALAAGLLGSPQEAMERARIHSDRVRAAGAEWAMAWAELTWAMALSRNGDAVEALTVGSRALARQVAFHDQWGALWILHVRTWSLAKVITQLLAGSQSDGARVQTLATETARVVGGLRTSHKALGGGFGALGPLATATAQAAEVARRVLGVDAYAAAENWGAQLRPESSELERFVLGTLSTDTPSKDETTGVSPLWNNMTKAEQEVAALAAAGCTDSEIAAYRGTSLKTVNAQMSTVLQKLMIPSRRAIIRFVPPDHLERIRAGSRRRPKR